MKKTTKASKSAAILTIYRPGSMTKRGRLAISAWLRRSADDLESLGDEYTEGKFVARYLY